MPEEKKTEEKKTQAEPLKDDELQEISGGRRRPNTSGPVWNGPTHDRAGNSYF